MKFKVRTVGGALDLQRILRELKDERARLDRAIAALDGSSGRGVAGRAYASEPSNSAAARPARRKHRLTAEGRRRLSENMKKRWAERKRKAAKASRAA